MKSARVARVDAKRVAAVTGHMPHDSRVHCHGPDHYPALWNSNLKVWDIAMRTCAAKWIVVLENDAYLPPNYHKQFAKYSAGRQVLNLDSRNGYHEGSTGCCTVGMAYRRDVLPLIVSQFSPDNPTALWRKWNGTTWETQCLFDWYMHDVLTTLRLDVYTAGFVRHPPTNAQKDM